MLRANGHIPLLWCETRRAIWGASDRSRHVERTGDEGYPRNRAEGFNLRRRKHLKNAQVPPHPKQALLPDVPLIIARSGPAVIFCRPSSLGVLHHRARSINPFIHSGALYRNTYPSINQPSCPLNGTAVLKGGLGAMHSTAGVAPKVYETPPSHEELSNHCIAVYFRY